MAQSDARESLATRQPTTDQRVLHLDMDCFFVACERARRPELRGEPVIVGGGFNTEPPRGVVATASYEAREYGVESAQPISAALNALPRRCTAASSQQPTAYYLEGDHEFYSAMSDEIMGIVEREGDTVRQVSIDEAYLDCTAATTWETVEAFARALKSQIEQAVDVPASVGASPTLSCAKVASEFDKPDGCTVVRPGEVQSFLGPLAIEEIHGVGPVSAERFHEAGIDTAGELAMLTSQDVLEQFGENTTTIHDRVRGIDPREVTPVGRPKSLSKEKSIQPTDATEAQRALLRRLARKVDKSVSATGARYRTIGIKVVETPFEVNSRETSFQGPLDDEQLLVTTALDLFEEFHDTEVRKLGVKVSNLDFSAGEQLRLDEWTPPARSIASPEENQEKRLHGQTRLSEFTHSNLSE